MSKEILYQFKHFGQKVTLQELRDFVDKALGFDDDTLIEIGRDALTIEMTPSSEEAHDPRDAFPRDELGRFVKRR